MTADGIANNGTNHLAGGDHYAFRVYLQSSDSYVVAETCFSEQNI